MKIGGSVQEKFFFCTLPPSENYNHIAARSLILLNCRKAEALYKRLVWAGWGRAKPAISVATPPPPSAPSAVGLEPSSSARQ